jgi:hypothetical protein
MRAAGRLPLRQSRRLPWLALGVLLAACTPFPSPPGPLESPESPPAADGEAPELRAAVDAAPEPRDASLVGFDQGRVATVDAAAWDGTNVNADAIADRPAELDARQVDASTGGRDARVVDARVDRAGDAPRAQPDARVADARGDRPGDRAPAVDARKPPLDAPAPPVDAPAPPVDAAAPPVDAAAPPVEAGVVSFDARPPADAPVKVDAPAPPADLAPEPDLAPPSFDAAAEAPPDSTSDEGAPDARSGRPNGAACVVGGDCQSGHCVDRSCCTVAACPGDCNFCAGPGGTCMLKTFFVRFDVEGCVIRHACDDNLVCRRLTEQSCKDFNDCLGERCTGGVCRGTGTWSMSPELVDFGDVPVGESATATFSVRNDTNHAADPIALGVLPEGNDVFEILPGFPPCDRPVLAHDECAFVIKFTPTDAMPWRAIVRARRDDLLILTQASIGGSGTLAPAAARVGPTFWDHGFADVGNLLNAAAPFVIDNPAGGGRIDSIRFEGRDPGDFRVVDNGCPAVIEPGTKCTLFVHFEPTSPGPRAARLVVSGSAGSTAAGMYGTAR